MCVCVCVCVALRLRNPRRKKRKEDYAEVWSVWVKGASAPLGSLPIGRGTQGCAHVQAYTSEGSEEDSALPSLMQTESEQSFLFLMPPLAIIARKNEKSVTENSSDE